MAIKRQTVVAAALLVLALGATAARDSGERYTYLCMSFSCIIANIRLILSSIYMKTPVCGVTFRKSDIT